jgi:putative glutamine amidotransferase
VRPLIGVVGRRSQRLDVLRFSGTIAAEAICEAVWAGGGEPLVLHGPDADPTAELATRLQRFDGVLLPGGADLDPRRYGGEPVSTGEPPVEHQDTLDLAVAGAVVAAGLPALAVCRGMQVLNVALGGTLVPDLPASAVDHRCSVHDVLVDPGTRLHAIVGATRIPVSSYHHQAVDVLAPELRVVARTEDGVVEAVEHTAADVLAVQWHPEDLAATSSTDAALFEDLVDRARRHRLTMGGAAA